MVLATKIGWLLLALLHLAPAAVFVAPGLVSQLYGVDPGGDVGVLIAHRGALFLGIVLLAILAAFDHQIQRAATVVVAISMVGFLITYGRAGLPAGALQTIAVADLIGLAPLALVSYQAWGNQTTS